jgi:4-hydroxy-2,2'-bipyrrole-5-carbaldehyde O-methyltransferase
VAAGASLGQWLRALRATPASQGRWRRLSGALLAWRDAAPFVRLHFLAIATEIGLLEELGRGPATANQLGARLAIGDQALFGAFLRLGAAVGELRCRAGRWSLHGRRSKALAMPEADTMRAMVQEAIGYDAAVYAGLDQHLRGAPPGDYLRVTGAVIARASRLVEPVLAPWLRSLVAERRPRRLLDVGCGTGVYLIHAATAGDSQLTGLGVDLDATVVGLARQRLADAGLAGRFDVRHADIRTLQLPAASFDLVLLFQNIYYFAEGERPGLLGRLHGLLAPAGRWCSPPCSRAAHWPPSTTTCCFEPLRAVARCPAARNSTASSAMPGSPPPGGCGSCRWGRSTRSWQSAKTNTRACPLPPPGTASDRPTGVKHKLRAGQGAVASRWRPMASLTAAMNSSGTTRPPARKPVLALNSLLVAVPSLR